MKRLIVYVFLSIALSVHGQGGDSLRVSLLTCAPGDEIYSLFGHTAIRCEDFTRRTDMVYNYGMFSFNSPNFIYRFVKGETDYQLGVVPYRYFEMEYALRGSAVYQQVLNLSADEKERLVASLAENYLPENRTYRYNYFYDNCTTRARDRIEQAVDGLVIYPDTFPGKTFRGIVHEFTAGSEWNELGIDLCLGKEADREIGARWQMFSPFYMRWYAGRAYIINKVGEKRPLVLDEKVLVNVPPKEARPGFPASPYVCSIVFLIVCILFGWSRWKGGHTYWGWDLFLYASQGLAGCVIAFLFFFSIHPTVDSNWLLWLFNPLPLLYLPVLLYREIKRRKDRFHVVNVVYLTLFIAIFPFCGQRFNLTVLPLALGLLINSVSHILVWNKR